ncbi:putative transcriptional regulator [Nitratireductor basaltis]|uniref:Putative transcriptional regulator n=2 Tax=Nitratireductor basaltis TaxID=472175 RepID=A0A084UEJ4_9HYPH|nr:putative transcriptional regulator [Nitratireductor basaltis]
MLLNHMVEHDAQLDLIFHALADTTRRHMLDSLKNGERSISALAEPFSMSLAGASKHLRVLEQAGLVRRRKEGRINYCRLDAMRLAEARSWISHYERFWNARLDELQALLEAEDKVAAKKPAKPMENGDEKHD